MICVKIMFTMVVLLFELFSVGIIYLCRGRSVMVPVNFEEGGGEFAN